MVVAEHTAGLWLEAGEEDDTVALGVNNGLCALLKCSKWAIHDVAGAAL